VEATRLTRGYRPGLIAHVIAMHMSYYAPRWGFGALFESKLAQEMGEFHSRYDSGRDLFVTAVDANDEIIGSITVDGAATEAEGAHLRWFIVNETLAGRGIGSVLMESCMTFLKEKGYQRAYLTTFQGLDAARRLYERHGFVLTEERQVDPWSGDVGLQHFEWRSS